MDSLASVTFFSQCVWGKKCLHPVQMTCFTWLPSVTHDISVSQTRQKWLSVAIVYKYWITKLTELPQGSSTLGSRLESLEDLYASACYFHLVKITETGCDESRAKTQTRVQFISSTNLQVSVTFSYYQNTANKNSKKQIRN